MIQFGLRLHDAEKLPLEQVLPLVRQRGFTCAHLALSKSLKEVPNTPSALTPGYAAYLRRLFAQNGIDIAVLGNYLNLAHPDEDALHAIQEKYYAHIRFASPRAVSSTCWPKTPMWWPAIRAETTPGTRSSRSRASSS